MNIKPGISIQRRIAEAVSAKLHYDFLCFKGRMMDEAYLTHGVSDILSAVFDPAKFEIRKNYSHPCLATLKPGRKPEIDYVVIERLTGNIVLAIEAKWAGSSHCTPENILWDIVRLKILGDSNPHCCSSLLIAGHKPKFENLFKHNFFKQRTQHPLQHGTTRKKVFSLIENKDHQEFINSQKKIWTNKYPQMVVPDILTTILEDPTKSANEVNRFYSKTWIVN